MTRKIKLSVLIACHWLVHALRIYPSWSKLYQAIYHRKFRNIVLTEMTPLTAESTLRLIEWRPDRWKEWGDVVGSPHWVQYCLNTVKEGRPQPEGALDCDDFALWSAQCLSTDYEPLYFTTSWMDMAGKFTGHAVCVFFRGPLRKLLYHIGNWGTRGPFPNLRSISKKMIDMSGGIEPIGWSLYTKDMKLIDFGKGMPPINNLIDGP